jgi:hypothetical protein
VANFAREVRGSVGPQSASGHCAREPLIGAAACQKRRLSLEFVFQPKGGQEFDVRLAQLLMGRQDPLFDVLLYPFVR